MDLMFKLFKSGWRDIFAALKNYELAGVLGWQDIRQRYRRSSLGPFWLTISMGVLIGVLGFVFGNLFATPMDEWLTVGDAEFQEKAQQRLDEIVKKTSILVIATHSPELVAQVCNRTIRLDRGALISV